MSSWESFADQWATLHGGVDPRHARPELRRFVKAAYGSARVLVKLRIRPAVVTATGLLLAVAAPVFAVRHGAWPALAALLVLASAVADGLDGAVAVVSGRTSALGSVCDALADRLAELSWMVAFWLVGVPGWLGALALGISWFHEYVRARASAAGMAEIGAITMAERPTRAVLAVAGLLFAALGALFNRNVSAGSATLVTGVWVVVGLLGLAQLLLAVVRVLRHAPPIAPSTSFAAAAATVASSPAGGSAGAWPDGSVGPVGDLRDGEAPTEELSAGDGDVTLPVLLDPRD